MELNGFKGIQIMVENVRVKRQETSTLGTGCRIFFRR